MTGDSTERAGFQERRILLGRISGAFGIKGEAKLESWTEPRSAIFRYQPWILRDTQGNEREVRGVRGKESGKYTVATFPDITDRDAIEAMRGTEIYVPRSALPPPSEGEYYWVDLEGLRVVTVDGVPLGTVSHLFATGANDVLVARDDERERMIPFVQPQYVVSVDFSAGMVTVDWDPDF
ncbi:ribosome maturation factor RimM [Lysobacter sp. FW306-1B-D06B]|uniref:ribosome maturation factor RimM n=1 Tax=Lysobacter sp. FW306-1B-D06B TaxID=3140250 RepID=UPI00313FE6FB